MTPVQQRLFALQDPDYRAFHCTLIPNVPVDKVIGIRTPALRSLARELSGTHEAELFLDALPHEYYEENNLHGFLLCRIRDYGKCVEEIDRFLPFVDNWATCDSMSPSCFGRNPEALEADIRRWIASGLTFTVRFGLRCLMNHFLEGRFRPKYLDWAASVRSEEYYVNMMVAWFFATALAKQYDAALPYLENRTLAPWVHNKTIQKARESYRITPEQKEYLKTLKTPLR